MPIPNYIDRKRQLEINNLIDEILLITGKSYPQDSLIDIIKSYIPGVNIVEHDFDGNKNIRGAIYKKGSKFKESIIAIQKSQKKEAKTFTLAHEFAHFSLGHAGKANYMIDNAEYDGSKRMQKEAEAQYFAGVLLMPTGKFMELKNYLTVSQLAQRFGVSESAVRVRKAWLDGKEQLE
jgi:Zn-dependent peptidase ImmA (M78 family)